MNYLGIQYEMKNPPVLDPGFIPFGIWAEAYLSKADHPIAIAVEREDGKIHVHRSFLRGEEYAEANYRYLERLVKLLLWSVGGFRVILCGCDALADRLRESYRIGGERGFDADFMATVYERPMELVTVDEAGFPAPNEQGVAVGGHLEGCRIGFDAGGSDRKVSAVIDGVSVYSEEVVWFPKTQSDPQYHYDGIVAAFRTAASKMPRVDAIGVSSAGVFVDNKAMVASLFLKVPPERREEVKTIYERAAREIGDVPLTVANDGDVTALAGAMSLRSGAVLGLAMGTSEAVGYVGEDGKLLGWLNELAFAPVDLNAEAMQDEWSTDYGAGCKYFSQDAVIRLAPAAGIELEEALSPAEKLKVVQKLAEQGNENARAIFLSIGSYLAYTLLLYSRIYQIRYLLVLGRVASGIGGELIVSECRRILAEEYPSFSHTIRVTLPDEAMRRIGQSVAAASLPEV